MDLVLYKSHRGIREKKCCIIECHQKCCDGLSNIAHSDHNNGVRCVNNTQCERYHCVHLVNATKLEQYQNVHGVNEQCHVYGVRHGIMLHSKHQAHTNPRYMLPIVRSNIITTEIVGGRHGVVFVHHHVVSNPLQTFSVLEPLKDGSCASNRVLLATVAQSAKRRRCLVAINAGFYNAQSGVCYGTYAWHGRIFLNYDPNLFVMLILRKYRWV